MKGRYYVAGGQQIGIPLRVNSEGQVITALTAGEDVELDIVRATPKFSYAHLATSGNQATLKTGAGLLGRVIINSFTASGQVTLYDGTATTGSVIAIVKLNGTAASEPPYVAPYDVAFSSGLFINLDRAMDVTVSYL